MMWAVLVVLLVGIGLVFGAPFLDFLAPEAGILLVDATDTKNPIILATGSATLWHQWQVWLYLGLFCLILVTLCNVIAGFIQSYVDQGLSDKKQKLDEQIAEFKRSQTLFEQQRTQEIEARLAHEYQRLEQMEHDAITSETRARTLKNHAEQINKATNLNHDKQKRENRSKLAQRDRLREQKRLLAEYLPHSGWKYADGTTPTYHDLLKEAQDFERKNRFQH
ncbi:Hypothetical protein C942_02319 [Photobacterium marinum]|uniref:Uncharacterized protein n=1 Tax=Photobacterium marinum TaxID=1056511 RepID=L8J760_9GAMM|nr:hypothetical protein [Photobacterium marinum]ELR64626.1 Hypothetical protein C942_02319 [Photobacterium marinum]